MSHGSSPAAWTAVLLALVGTTIGGIGLVPEPNWIVFTIGCVIAVIAGPVGLIMSKTGRGAQSHGAQSHGAQSRTTQGQH